MGSKQAVWEVKDPLLGSEVDGIGSTQTHDSTFGGPGGNGRNGSPNRPGVGGGKSGYPPNSGYGGAY